MLFRVTALLPFCLAGVLCQTPAVSPTPQAPISGALDPVTPPSLNALVPDSDDPAVIHARLALQRVKDLVETGALPRVRLKKALDELQDAEDMSLLRQSLYTKDLTVEQTDQMIAVAERMVFRRQTALAETQALVASGILSRSEADASQTDLDRAMKELEWAQARSRLVAQLAESLRLQQSIVRLEMQAEQHPESIGAVTEKYTGSGIFTGSDLQKVEIAFLSKFAKPLPISANGETAVHRSMGFDHRGRVDVAINPDQPEGRWLRQYLMARRIPFFAFRAAVARRATGAHIHIGPQSTRFVSSAGSDHATGR